MLIRLLLIASLAVVIMCTPSPVYKGDEGSKKVTIIPVKKNDVFTGMASYYGKKFQGKPTASGERFDMYKLTAAHTTMPFGTLLRITNLHNSMQVVVKINDRGPFIKKRIIDLSFAAAREIGMLESGTARVRLEVIGTAPMKIKE